MSWEEKEGSGALWSTANLGLNSGSATSKLGELGQLTYPL